MKLQSLVHRLEAWLQEERGVQGRLLSLLEAQEKAVLAGDASALEITGRNIEQELSSEARREKRRRELLDGFASLLGVPARILTVRSLVERLGPEAGRVGRLAGELRGVVLDVRKRAGRVASIARVHQEVMRDVLCLLLGERNPSQGGVLVDAEV